jgi:autotransporter-associated beta strand protein
MKTNHFLLLVVLLITIGNGQSLNAQSYYKVHHINENFDVLEETALPNEWSAQTGTAGLFTRGGGRSIKSGALETSGSGSGLRGVDIMFPAPQSNAEIGTSDTWFIEFDWKVNSAVQGPRNAVGVVISGAGSQNPSAANWYLAGILGIYSFGDGYLHYWNMDQEGYDDDPIYYDADEENGTDLLTIAHNGKIGPVFRSGSNAAFRRVGRTTGSSDEYVHSADNVTAWNASTKTNVAYADSVAYHIVAKLNFATQTVESLSITENGDAGNTQTILNMPFLAPSTIGEDTTLVARDQRIVSDISIISSFNTKASLAGNGSDSRLNATFDNMEIYYLKESVGTTNVTIYYKDQDGNTAKAPRVAENQQINELFRLLDSDKYSFADGGFYYAYDKAATITANAGKSDDGESMLVTSTNNSFTVVFKKSVEATGALIWTGDAGPQWNEIDGNFKAGTISGLGYQKGHDAEFSGASAPKDIVVDTTIDLGTNDVTVSTGGYSFSGTGKLTGTGRFFINAPVTLGVQNSNAAVVNTTEAIHIKHPEVADSLQVINNARLKLEAEATFSKKIIGAGEGSTLHIEALTSKKDANYSFTVDNVSTVNFYLKKPGKQDGASWTGSMVPVLPENAQLNVINALDIDTIAGFSGVSSNMQNVKMHLGDSVRLVRNYNEASSGNEVVTFGEITGTTKSIIEGGFVGGRIQTYAVGNLNTDAVFNGSTRRYLNHNGTWVDNTLHLNKVGTGKWTLTGHVNHQGDITVKAGTLELLGKVDTLVTTITVDSAAVLRTGAVVEAGNIFVNKDASLYSRSTAFAGDVQVNGALRGTEKFGYKRI